MGESRLQTTRLTTELVMTDNLITQSPASFNLKNILLSVIVSHQARQRIFFSLESDALAGLVVRTVNYLGQTFYFYREDMCCVLLKRKVKWCNIEILNNIETYVQ